MAFVKNTLRQGDSGQGVRTLERHLIRTGVNLGFATDYFTENMEQEVRNFQSNQGLSVDGVVGPNTQARFIAVNTFSNGDVGPGVEQLQAALNRFTIECAVDGIYGSETANAVQDFQGHNSIQTDGIAGPVTMDTLDKALNIQQVSEGDGGTIFASVIRAVQKGLSEHGMDIAIDGIFGPNTANAVQNLQETLGQPKTGTADRPILQFTYQTFAFSLFTDEQITTIIEQGKVYDLLEDYVVPGYNDDDPYATIAVDKEAARNDGLSEDLVNRLEALAKEFNDTFRQVVPLGTQALTIQSTREGNNSFVEVRSFGIGPIQYTEFELSLDNVNTDRLLAIMSGGFTAATGGAATSAIGTLLKRVHPAITAVSFVAEGIALIGYTSTQFASAEGCGVTFSIAVPEVGSNYSAIPYWVTSQC